MNIREWFGGIKEYDQSTLAAISLDSFLEIYAKATMKYLNVSGSQSLEDIFDFLPKYRLKKIQKLFLEYLEEKGLSQIMDILSSDLSQSELLIPHIEYYKYILKAEIDFEYPDNVRSFLVDLPIYLSWDIDRIREDLENQGN